jgi:hypothetical protein
MMVTTVMYPHEVCCLQQYYLTSKYPATVAVPRWEPETVNRAWEPETVNTVIKQEGSSGDKSLEASPHYRSIN